MTSVLYYYLAYDLDRSSEIIGGYRFIGKFVYYYFSKDIDSRSSAILHMMD